ncbi:hypothetical protein LOTGIDRAFT_229482 [Lottia gigantea]|uniref:Uncharacterized protein n=1 Tax=Lottia gigantea TaxID=225164 RepID=V4B9N4_LOTGI|nr:hypothetical protein LOTGIDRAFT_229482 [Lottia gigantea]ESO85669.1 hypothetical protein LOTGIDRAFT_229482 [Lottia gigantea]
MLRYLLVLVVFAATCMVDAKVPLCREALQVDEVDKEIPLTEDVAKALLDKSSDKSKVLSSMPQQSKALVSGAKLAPILSLGPIISRPKPLVCPKYRPFYWGPQELCPSKKVKVYTLSSRSYGFCYVLFPHWQNIYESRCLCPTCRLNCSPTNTTFRHRCVRDPKPYVYKKVWAICYRSGSWQIRNFSHNFFDGKCTCKTYYRGRCRG